MAEAMPLLQSVFVGGVPKETSAQDCKSFAASANNSAACNANVNAPA
jgi:hypothetical protein